PPSPTSTPTFTATVTPTPHPFSLATIVVRNGTGQSGLATRTSERLRAQGFRVLPPEDDPQQGHRPHTLILDRGDHAQVRQALAAFLYVAPEYITVNAAEESEADIILILGDDFESLSSATPTPTPALAEVPTPTPNPYAGATIAVRNGTRGRPGLAGRTADRLRAQGFVVLAVEDDDRAGSRPYTLILDRGDHARVRQALAEFLKVKDKYIEINSKVNSTADIVVILGDDFRE
ncbi:MAG: LytR C-terminal domain-containing protein, partial [Chloroflexia bacterium]